MRCGARWVRGSKAAERTVSESSSPASSVAAFFFFRRDANFGVNEKPRRLPLISLCEVEISPKEMPFFFFGVSSGVSPSLFVL